MAHQACLEIKNLNQEASTSKYALKHTAIMRETAGGCIACPPMAQAKLSDSLPEI